MNKVAVYGSLLSGLGNHPVLSSRRAKLLGTDKTASEYTMHSFGAYPAITEGGSTSITIEVYEVDDECLQACNRLEGFRGEDNPGNFYNRKVIKTRFGNAYIYYLNEVRSSSPVVEDGDWRNWVTNRREKYGY